MLMKYNDGDIIDRMAYLTVMLYYLIFLTIIQTESQNNSPF